MTVLPDHTLALLYPKLADAIGPASIDLHLSSMLTYWPDWVRRNPRQDQSKLWRPVDLLCPDEVGSAWVLRPGVRYLGATRERLTIPVNMAGQIAARSSWGRDGLSVICGPAGWIDPGFSGHIVLELAVIGSELVLWPGAAVCQLVLMTLTSACERPYSGKYQNQSGPTPSRLYREVEPVS